MDITTQIQLISLLIVILFVVVIMQSISVAYILKSWSGWLKAVGFCLWGVLQVWGFIRLPAAILRAQGFVNKQTGENAMPVSLTKEQWGRILIAIVALGFLIAGFDKLRRDLHKLGI